MFWVICKSTSRHQGRLKIKCINKSMYYVIDIYSIGLKCLHLYGQYICVYTRIEECRMSTPPVQSSNLTFEQGGCLAIVARKLHSNRIWSLSFAVLLLLLLHVLPGLIPHIFIHATVTFLCVGFNFRKTESSRIAIDSITWSMLPNYIIGIECHVTKWVCHHHHVHCLLVGLPILYPHTHTHKHATPLTYHTQQHTHVWAANYCQIIEPAPTRTRVIIRDIGK